MPETSEALVRSIEQATAQAVAPARVQELGPWLLCFDTSTVWRAKSAAPLGHSSAACDELLRLLPELVQSYQAAGLPLVVRQPMLPGLAPLIEALTGLGLKPAQPTQVMTAATAQVVARCQALHAAPQAHLRVVATPSPSPEWAAVFTSEGFNAADGASRVRVLSRAQSGVYVSLQDESGTAISCGLLALFEPNGPAEQRLASLHGLRTRVAAQGQGLGTRLIGAMAQVAAGQGIEAMFLQVEAENPARALYERLGFSDAWSYSYYKVA